MAKYKKVKLIQKIKQLELKLVH